MKTPYSLLKWLAVTICNFEDIFIDVSEKILTVQELSDTRIFRYVKMHLNKIKNNSNDEEVTATPLRQLTSIQSLNMIFKFKDYFNAILGVKEGNLFKGLRGLQTHKFIILSSNIVFQKSNQNIRFL